MRSAEELVEELDREAKRLSMVAIVVAFDDTSRFVFHDDDHDKMVTELRSMIDGGGEPTVCSDTWPTRRSRPSLRSSIPSTRTAFGRSRSWTSSCRT